MPFVFKHVAVMPDCHYGKGATVGTVLATDGAIIPAEPNNAFLVSIALYSELVPAFERVLAAQDHDLGRFYEKVRALAALDKAGRTVALGEGNVDDLQERRPGA